MKNSNYTKVAVIIMVILFVIVSMLGCTVHNHSHSHSHHKSKKMPPGQAKKISGDKSAKSHAHGHR
ncbi:hypothetical protein [Flavobacterium gyeonganense]|uniref:Quinol oxidase subunit 4 n=1 Tax=Flavobacterium gyeonganense TaxID=1310418 RepID=A0ABV5HFY1_9FLAO|nr:hypothetical protein [Flavobacterium gyeonganense]